VPTVALLPALPDPPVPGVGGERTAFPDPFGGPVGDPLGPPGGSGEVPGAIPEPDSSGEEPLVPGGDVRAPVLVERIEPDYPEAARKARIEGVVILQAVIGPTGAIEELRVLKSLFPALDGSALSAVRRWRYLPATLNGRAVRVLLTVTVDYRLR
jgi:protein TonB